MPDKFISIKEALFTEPGLNSLRNSLKQSEVVEMFFSIFPELKKLVTPVNVIKKVLLLKVDNSVLRSELKFNQEMLTDKINKYFNEERVKSIRFVS